MKLNIGGKDFNFAMNGTVGVQFIVERVTGEKFNAFGKYENGELLEEPNNNHIIVFLLTLLQLSNPDKKEEITIDWFLSNLTSALLSKMQEYVIQRWIELESGTVVEDLKENSDTESPKKD